MFRFSLFISLERVLVGISFVFFISSLNEDAVKQILSLLESDLSRRAIFTSVQQ